MQQPQKDPISPNKITLLTSLFVNRTDGCPDRRKRLNKCISDSIFKITEKLETKERRYIEIL